MELSRVLCHRLVGVKVCAMRSDDTSCVWSCFMLVFGLQPLSSIFMAFSKSSSSWVQMTGGREDNESLSLHVAVHGRTLPNYKHTCDRASSATIGGTVRLSASCLVSHCWSSVFKLCYHILHRQWNILFLASTSFAYSPLEQTNRRPSHSPPSASKPKARHRQPEQRVQNIHRNSQNPVFACLLQFHLIFSHIFTFAVSCSRWYNFLFLAPLCVEPQYPVCTRPKRVTATKCHEVHTECSLGFIVSHTYSYLFWDIYLDFKQAIVVCLNISWDSNKRVVLCCW